MTKSRRGATPRPPTPTPPASAPIDDLDRVYEVRMTGRQIELAFQLFDLAVRGGGLAVSAIALNVSDAITASKKTAA